jgi:hypothetical protein
MEIIFNFNLLNTILHRYFCVTLNVNALQLTVRKNQNNELLAIMVFDKKSLSEVRIKK